MVDSTDKLEQQAADRKAKRLAGRTGNKAKANRGAPLPVMSQAEQRRKLHELRAQFLKSNRLDSFITKLFDVAMDDDHSAQAVAMKMIADRILPATSFSGEDKKSSAVQINITGLQVSSVEKEVKSDEPSHRSQMNGDDVVSIQ